MTVVWASLFLFALLVLAFAAGALLGPALVDRAWKKSLSEPAAPAPIPDAPPPAPTEPPPIAGPRATLLNHKISGEAGPQLRQQLNLRPFPRPRK